MRIARRELLAGAAALTAARHLPAAAPRPNIVFILADDLDPGELGGYGGRALTPHLDGLKRDGLELTRYYVTSAVCTPSRYSVVTGRYASRSLGLQRAQPTRVPCRIQWNTPVLAPERTIAHRLRAAGYATGIVGKWHLGGVPPERFRPRDQATDLAVAARLAAHQEALCAYCRETCGFSYAAALYHDNVDVNNWLPEALRVHNQEWITAAALDFLDRHHRQPFYLYVPTTLPHGPSPLASLRADPCFTAGGILDAPPAVQPPRDDVLRRVREAGLPEATVGSTWLDDGVGAILRRLDELGVADNTLVVFASDNTNRGKMTCYDGGARVPCFLRWPGVIAPGRTSDALLANLDLPALFANLAGADVPADDPVDGRSFAPLLEGHPMAEREALLLEVNYTRAVATRDGKYLAVRFPPRLAAQVAAGERLGQGGDPAGEADFHAARDFPGYFDADQLYDLNADPREQTNLAADPTHAAALATMRERLRALSAGMPYAFGEFGAG